MLRALFVRRLTYPIPPAGADVTWVPEPNTPPFGVTFSLPSGSILPGIDFESAIYDMSFFGWSKEGMGAVTHRESSGAVSFTCKINGILGVIQKKTMLPYKEWHVRPTQGQYGGRAIVQIQTGMTICQAPCLSVR